MDVTHIKPQTKTTVGEGVSISGYDLTRIQIFPRLLNLIILCNVKYFVFFLRALIIFPYYIKKADGVR